MVLRNKKIKIHSNHICNLKCKFCYYGDSACIKEKDPTLDEIKSWLKKSYDLGARDVDFCGGEPTLRSDFPEILAYTKNLGYRIISVTTNGQRMANPEYVKILINAGLNDALFSLHGHNAKVHDSLTCVPGSFDKIIKAIKNIKKSGITLRINSTVTKANYKNLEKFAKLVCNLEPNSLNFIKFNPWDVALSNARELMPRYSEMAPYIKKAIDILNKKVKKVTIRYFPFCFMQGYEKHVSDTKQILYDVDEWGQYYIQNSMQKRKFSDMGKLIKKLIKKLPILLRIKPSWSYDTMMTDFIEKNLYIQVAECKKCKYCNICPGIDRHYPKIYSTNEIVAVKGERITDPMFFRGKYLEEYDKRYIN